VSEYQLVVTFPRGVRRAVIDEVLATGNQVGDDVEERFPDDRYTARAVTKAGVADLEVKLVTRGATAEEATQKMREQLDALRQGQVT
jgi:hypothetical protein